MEDFIIIALILFILACMVALVLRDIARRFRTPRIVQQPVSYQYTPIPSLPRVMTTLPLAEQEDFYEGLQRSLLNWQEAEKGA